MAQRLSGLEVLLYRTSFPCSGHTALRYTCFAVRTAEALQDCLESTDWDVLCEPHGEDFDKMTDCITQHIRFWEDTDTTGQRGPCTASPRRLLLQEQGLQVRVQHEPRDMLRTCKDNYRRKV